MSDSKPEVKVINHFDTETFLDLVGKAYLQGWRVQPATSHFTYSNKTVAMIRYEDIEDAEFTEVKEVQIEAKIEKQEQTEEVTEDFSPDMEKVDQFVSDGDKDALDAYAATFGIQLKKSRSIENMRKDFVNAISK